VFLLHHLGPGQQRNHLFTDFHQFLKLSTLGFVNNGHPAFKVAPGVFRVDVDFNPALVVLHYRGLVLNPTHLRLFVFLY